MSNFSKPSASSVAGVLTYINEVSNGLFGILSLVALFIVNYMSLSYFGVKKALTVSLFNTSVLGIFLVSMGIFTGTSTIFIFIAALVLVTIWAVMTGV